LLLDWSCPILRVEATPRAGRCVAEESAMNSAMLRIYLFFQELKDTESGQDLVEYALLSSLIALSAISGVSHIASAVTKVFSNVSTSLA
jgi:Flp pilus assembly pilin Flp